MRSTRRLVLSCAPCLLLFLISALRPAAAETVTDFYYSVAEDGTLVQESGPPDVKPRQGTPVILYAANDSDIPIPDNGTEVISEIIMPPEHQSIPFKTSKIHFRIVHPVTSDIYAVIQDVVVWNREAQSYPNPERTYDHVTTYGDKWIRPILRVRDYKPGNTGYIDLFEVWFEHVDDITGPTNPGNPRIVAPDDHGMRDNDNITNIDRPEFIWYPSTDNMSGVDAYFISYTDNTPDGVGVGDYIIGAIGDKQPPPPPSWKLKPTDPPIPQGVHQLAIRAIDGAGNLGGVTLLAFEIDLTAPAVPILLEPADRAVIGTPQPLLKWSDVGPVWKYEIALRDQLLIGSLAGESGVPQWQVHPPLAYLGWTWKVRAFDVAGNVGTFSPERLVTIAAQPPPPPTAVRILPADDTGTSSSDAITSKDRPRFDWAAPDVPAGVHTYEVSIDDGAARPTGANVPGWQPPPGEAFAEGTRQVRFRAVEGSTERLPGAWSAPYFFTIDRTPPPPPALLAPAAAAELEDSTPLLDWSDVPGAGKYRVRVTDQRTPEDARLAEATASAWEVTPALPLRQWFWQVQAIDIAGNEGAFAPALAFVMTAPPPPPPTNVRLTLADDTGISDSDGLTNVARPALRWSAPIVPSGIAGWEIELDGAPRELTGTLAQWGLPATEPALAEGAHTFRVRTIEGSDRRKRGDWTSHFCFTVDRTPPPAPGLYAPAAGAVFGGKSPLFTWQSLAGIWKCQVVLQPDLPSSDTERRSDERVHANWTPLAPLARGMWRWQIRAWDIAGNAGAFDLSPTGPWSRFEVRPPATLVASLRDGDDLATPSQVLMALGPIRMVSGHNPATIEGVTPLEPQRLEAWRLGPRGYELWHETTLTLQPEQRQELSLLRALPRAIESGIESTGPASALATARLYTGTWYFSPEVYTGPPVRLRVWVDRDGNEPYDACADSPFQLFPYNKKLQVQFPVDSIPAGAHQWCYELETQLGNGRVVRTDASDWRPAFTVPLRAGVEGRFEPSHAVIGRGGAPVFELPLRNTGNTTDSLTLTPLLPAGWSADLSAAAMTLAPGESWRTVARLTPPAAVAPGRHVVRCRVHSAAAGGVVAEIETEVIVTAAAAATLEGIVLDALTGAPLAGAQVAADASPAVATAATGRFTLPALDPLASAATFTRAGYFEARRPLRLEAGSTASLVVLMQPLGQATTRPILAEIRGSDFGPETPAFFIDGAPRTGTVEVLIDWGVKNPGHVRWITPRHTFTDPILGNVASRTFDFGADFGPHGRLRVVPIGSDNSEGDPLFANFQVIPPPPLGGILPGSRFHPVLAGGVLQYRLADRVGFHRALATWPASLIDPRVPLLGGRSFSLFAGGGVASGVYTTEGVAEARSLTGAALDLAGTGSGSAGTLDAAPLWNPESGRWQLLTKLSFGNEPRGLTGTQLLGEIGPRLPQDSMRVLPLSGAGIVAPSIAGSLSLADGTVAGGAWSGRLELAPAFDSLIAGRFEGSLVEHWLGGQFTSALDFTPAPQWLDSQLAIGGRSSLVSGSRISAASPAWGWPASTAEYDAITSTTRRADSIVLSRDYPTSTGAALADPRSTTLLQGVFPHAAPMLARIDAGMLAVWLDDDPALPADARTRLRWSRRTASGWSAPAWLADQAADSDPSLATLEDGSAVCVWARHLPRDGGTFIAIYEPGAGTWSAPERITSNTDPMLRAAGPSPEDFVVSIGEGLLRITQGNVAQLDIEQLDIHGFTLNYRPIDYALDYDGTTITLVRAASIVFNSTDPADLELTATTWAGELFGTDYFLTGDSVPDSSPRLLRDGDRLRLAWLRDGALMIAEGLDVAHAVEVARPGATLGAADLAAAGGPNGEIALAWSAMTPAGPELLGLFLDPDRDAWSKVRPLTADPLFERWPSAAFDEEGALVVAFNRAHVLRRDRTFTAGGRTLVARNVPEPGRADLALRTFTPAIDLAVASVTLDPPNPAAGSVVLIRATIANNGQRAAAPFAVAFNAGGALLGTVNTTGTLAGGDVFTCSAEWTVPSGAAPLSVTVTADPEATIDDPDRANNNLAVAAVRPDLAIASLTPHRVGTRLHLRVRVINLGGAPSTPFVLDSPLPLVTALAAEPAHPGLAPGAWRDILFDHPSPVRPTPYRVTIDHSGLIDDFDRSNNEALVYVRPGPIRRATGTLAIDVTPDTAPWSIVDADGVILTGSGDRAALALPVGPLSVRWLDLAGWVTPASPAPAEIDLAQTLALSGVWMREAAHAVITVMPATAGWRLIDSDGALTTGTGTRTLPVPAGPTRVEWLPLAGFTTPPPLERTLADGAQAQFLGLYVESEDIWLRRRGNIIRYLLGLDTNPAGLDANNDGRVDIADAVYCLEARPRP